MGLFYANLNPVLQACCALFAGVVCWIACRQIPWQKWQAPTVFSAWCASIIVLVLTWRMRIPLANGVDLHLLGLALFYLMFARPLAILGIGIAVMAYTYEYQGNWENLGVNIVLLAILPSYLSDFLLTASKRYLPRHLFVYLLGNGFFFTVLVNGLVACSALALREFITIGRAIPLDSYAYALLLCWGEAFLTGFIITIFTIYRPDWVLSFDDATYLNSQV